MYLKELFSRIERGEVAAHSELGTRDEAKQSKSFASRLRKLKVTVGIKAHVLPMKDLVIPFNPFTCVEDNQYNKKTPFRPILLVSQTLAGIKAYCAEHPEIAAKWEEILGAQPGSIDWNSEPTMADYFYFKHNDMIKPRVMSYSTVALNFGGRCGFPELRTKYTVDPTELNENNNYDFDKAPDWHQAAIFFNAMLKPEADELVSDLEKKRVDKTTITQQRRTIYSKAPVSFVTQTNLIPFIYYGMNEFPKVSEDRKVTDFEASIRWMAYNPDKWSGAMDEVNKDDSYDESMDFYDFTMRSPSSTETKGNKQVYTDDDTLELYQALKISNTDMRFSVVSGSTTVEGVTKKNDELYGPVFDFAKEYFMFSQEESSKDGGDTFEKLMGASNGFRPITTVIDRFYQACNQCFLDMFAQSKYFTENIKKSNAEFFAKMNPDNAMALAEYDDEELDEASASQAKALSSLIAEATSGDYIVEEGEATDLDSLPMSVE